MGIFHDFKNSFMKRGEFVQNCLSRVSAIDSHMKAYSDKITDETVVSNVLICFNKIYDHVVAVI